jgi:hypothetical protein
MNEVLVNYHLARLSEAVGRMTTPGYPRKLFQLEVDNIRRAFYEIATLSREEVVLVVAKEATGLASVVEPEVTEP